MQPFLYSSILAPMLVILQAAPSLLLPLSSSSSNASVVNTGSAFHLNVSFVDAFNDEFEEHRVPNTPITLFIDYLNQKPLDPDAMQRTLLQTQLRLRRYIKSRWRIEDDVLELSDDPYASDSRLVGCFFAIGHYPDGLGQPRRLTYRMVESVMKGVWDHIYKRERYVSVHMIVKDEELGVVGIAGLSKERPGTAPVSMALSDS
ncbi:MAG: hypothetical protein Q9195_000492 [Heterodermia aff. obscurata]